MEKFKLIYFISFLIVLLVFSVSLLVERKSIKAITKKIKGNSRVVVVTLLTIVIGIYNLIESTSITGIINSNNYKYINATLILCLIIWIYKSIKNKKISLIINAVDKKLNFEEIFIYVFLINILFPLGSDILNSKIKFPIQLSVSVYSDYPSYLIENKYANMHDVINIQNNEDKIYNIRIETFASQFRSKEYLDSISNEPAKDYNFYNRNAVIYYKNEGVVNSNSHIELDMFKGKAFIPNFIDRPINCDSFCEIISGDTLFYFNQVFMYAKQKHIIGSENIDSKSYGSFKILTPEKNWYYSFMMNWISKITVYNNYSTYTFKINRFFIHKATVFVNNQTGKIYLAPGLINNNCYINIKYLFDQQEKTFTKDNFTCQFIYDFNNGKTIYKDLGSGIINIGEISENIILKENSFPINFYTSGLYLIDETYYNQLIDNIIE